MKLLWAGLDGELANLKGARPADALGAGARRLEEDGPVPRQEKSPFFSPPEGPSPPGSSRWNLAKTITKWNSSVVEPFKIGCYRSLLISTQPDF